MDDAVTKKIDAYYSQFPKRHYPKGQILVFADESPEHIFYIKEGRVRKYGISYRGDEVIVNIFKPPAFFPMSWALNQTPNKYFYKTETDTELHIVPREAASSFLEDNPDVTLDLLKRIYLGMEGMLGRMIHLMSDTARNRLLYELIIECERFGEKQRDGSFVLNLNEQDLAARAGLSRETVSREMKNLKASTSVKVLPKQIIVTDLQVLKSVLAD